MEGGDKNIAKITEIGVESSVIVLYTTPMKLNFRTLGMGEEVKRGTI